MAAIGRTRFGMTWRSTMNHLRQPSTSAAAM